MAGRASHSMTLKVRDFIEIDYAGKLKETGEVFDSTTQGSHVHPVTICLGQGQILKGLDDKLVGKETGKDYTFVLTPEEGFGKKDAKLLKIVPSNVFLKQGIRPYLGLQVNIDGAIGTIRTVTGGRTIVDFNHPLSGHDVEYTVSVKRLVTDKKEQLTGLLDLEAHIHDPVVVIKEDSATISLRELPHEMLLRHLSARIKELIGLDAVFEKQAEKEA